MNPVCFMVMPFRRKAVTQAESGAPREVNFDRLWDAAFRPVLEKLGYLPVRADLESGSVIVKEMLNRLRHADLVLADVSISNGNVYYEVGIRHAAQETRCVCIAADWFKPLFDIAQFRVLTYPLKDGEVTDEGAAAIRDLLVREVPRFVPARTPYFDLTDERVEKAFTERAETISAFQGELQSVRLTRQKNARAKAAAELLNRYSGAASQFPGVVVDLVYLVRDALDWPSVREFVEHLAPEAARTETIQEQYFLALSELGEHEKAIAGLQELSRRFGATPERCGIIGGRFKRLFREERRRRRAAGEDQPNADERYYLNRAIQYYEDGMLLDLNEYYCACNLPGLLRDRGRTDDQERATAIDTQVVTACRRAEKTDSHEHFFRTRSSARHSARAISPHLKPSSRKSRQAFRGGWARRCRTRRTGSSRRRPPSDLTSWPFWGACGPRPASSRHSGAATCGLVDSKEESRCCRNTGARSRHR